MTPFVVVEGGVDDVQAARSDLNRAGWRVVDGFPAQRPMRPAQDADRTMALVEVHTATDAAAAVLLALSGASLLVAARAGREATDLLLEDLRHLGLVDHRPAGPVRLQVSLTAQQQDLLRLLLAGIPLREAGRQLAMSRRTADRRLSEIRKAYGVATTAGALRAARRAGTS